MKKTFSGIQWLSYYLGEIEKIKDASPFLAMLGISAGIEYLGKLLSTNTQDGRNDCNGRFERALTEFNSLKKYCNKNLYHLLRCGLAHSINVEEGIILSREQHSNLNTSPIIINTDEFYIDFEKAVEEAQEKANWPNSTATHGYVTIVNQSETGATETFLYL